MNFQLKIFVFIIIKTFPLLGQKIINIAFAKAKYEKVNINKLFDQIVYVQLDIASKSLMRNINATYYLSDKYIKAVNFFRRAYWVDRKSGKFIREVSRFGPGPNEYSFRMINYYGFDEINEILFADEWKMERI